MKSATPLLFLILVCATSTDVMAQAHHADVSLLCPDGDGTVRSRVLHTDSLTTSTLLCIHGTVQPHLHAYHTEQVYVLDGSAVMLLNDSLVNIGPGSFVTIPARTTHAVRVTGSGPLRVISIQSPRSDGSDRVPMIANAVWQRP